MANEMFSGRAASLSGPAVMVRAVTPDDASDLPDGPTRALFVGVGGAVAIMDQSGVETELRSGDGQYHPISVQRVLATGTTAESIVALY